MKSPRITRMVQNPGQYEAPSSEYHGYRHRSLIFETPWHVAQFYEINDQLIKHWKVGDVITMKSDDVYCSMNLSLHTSNFVEIFHDSDDLDTRKILDEIR
jgi:hypothetical protein